MINKKIVLGILTLAMIGVVAAGTYANWSVGSGAQTATLKAGTMTVSTSTVGGSQTGMYPGATGADYDLTLTNTGNIPINQIIVTQTVSDNDLSRALAYTTTGSGIFQGVTKVGDLAGAGVVWGLNAQTYTIPLTTPLANGGTIDVKIPNINLPATATTGAGQTSVITTTITANQ